MVEHFINRKSVFSLSIPPFCKLFPGDLMQCSFPKLFVSPRVCTKDDQEGKLLKFKGYRSLIFKLLEKESFIR